MDPDVESYLRFPATAAGGSIQRATLRINTPAGLDTGTADGPAAYATSWTGPESALTWNNRPARAVEAIDDKARIAADTWTQYDVTPIITGVGPWSLALATTSGDGVDFESREATHTPKLILTFAAG